MAKKDIKRNPAAEKIAEIMTYKMLRTLMKP